MLYLVLTPVISLSSSLVLSPVLTLGLLYPSHSMVTSGAKNLNTCIHPENQRWVAMASSNACIKLSCIKLNSAGHQISFGFAIFPFHDHIKNNLVHLAINKLTLSLRYSHLMNTAITKHHCSIPLSIEKLTFHLHRSIGRWWEPRVSPPRCLLQSFPPHPQWCPL